MSNWIRSYVSNSGISRAWRCRRRYLGFSGAAKQQLPDNFRHQQANVFQTILVPRSRGMRALAHISMLWVQLCEFLCVSAISISYGISVCWWLHHFFMFRLQVWEQSGHLIWSPSDACEVSPAQGVTFLPPHSKCELVLYKLVPLVWALDLLQPLLRDIVLLLQILCHLTLSSCGAGHVVLDRSLTGRLQLVYDTF